MRKFVFKLVVTDCACDEFWENNPTKEEVQEALESCLYNGGFGEEITIKLASYSENENLSWEG